MTAPLVAPRRRFPLLLAFALLPLVTMAQGSPTPQQPVCSPTVNVDAPATGATLRGGPLTLAGWAMDSAVRSGSGVEAVHVYLDGPAGLGLGLGAATLGLARPDVDAALGREASSSGWTFTTDVSSLPVGGHSLFIHVLTRCGWTYDSRGFFVAQPDGWALLNPPAARNSHAAVWDPIRSQMLVVGGRGGSTLSELWSYSPLKETWTPIEPVGGPVPPLLAHTAVWDTSNARMLVFGGFRGGRDGSPGLYAYDPSTNDWSVLPTDAEGPQPRGYHAAVWDAEEGRMLVYGGVGGSFDFLNDLWSFDVASDVWSRLTPREPSPSPRFYQSAAWDPVNRQMLVFGGAGLDQSLLNDLWAYRPDDNEWVRVLPDNELPPGRLSHSAVWDTVGEQMLVADGGCGGCYLSDLWSYRPSDNTWLRGAPRTPAPSERGGHTAVWDSTHGQMLLFAGASLNDLWAYQPTSENWKKLAPSQPSLPALARGRGIWDGAANELLVFGGGGRDRETPDLETIWSYRPGSHAWSSRATVGAPPPGRQGHSVVSGADGQALLFGGLGSDGAAMNDLWSYRSATSTWAPLSPAGDLPPSRAFHSAAWDPARGVMMVHGGTTRDGAELDDTWLYVASTNTWTRFGGLHPGARARHTAVWDTAGDQMLVFGGYRRQGGYLDELWAFRPSDDTWNRLVPEQPPSGRARHTAVWDPVGNRMLVLGGYAGGVDYYGDFWSYRPGDRAWQHLEVPGDQPGDRAEHVAVWDARDAQMLVMGGISADVYSELWSYKSPGARAGTPTEPPPVAATPSGPVLAPPTPMIAAPSVTPSSAVPAVTPSAVSKAPPKSTAGVR